MKKNNEKDYNEKNMNLVTKIITTMIIIFIIVVLVCLISYIYNNINFTNTLIENGYETKNNINFEKSNSKYIYNIEVIEHNIFSIPKIRYTKSKKLPDTSSYIIACIEINNIYNQEKNVCLPIFVPTNISTGQKMTISELKAQLDVKKEGYIIDYYRLSGGMSGNVENVTRDEWLKVSKDYISGVEEAYNEVVNMFK